MGLFLIQKGVPQSVWICWHTPFILFATLSVVLAVSGLLALMTILAQSLLTLVSSHLVALLLFSVWHNCYYLK